MKKLKAGIVGLGQVGLLFDEEKSRKGIWTHFSSYEYLSDYYDLVAVADPIKARRDLAIKRKEKIVATENLDSMLKSVKLDVISLCTPTSMHLNGLKEASGKVKGIFCEKPLSGIDRTAEASEILKKCEQNGTVVVVNYYKRKDLRFNDLSKFISDGMIGNIAQVNAFYSGPMETVGSHSVDLLIHLFGRPKVLGAARRDFGDESPGYDALFEFENGLAGHLVCTGGRYNLIFETDIIGENGRIRVLNNGDKLEYFTFKDDDQYQGYKSLEKKNIQQIRPCDRFVEYLEELWNAVNGVNINLTCSGNSALETQKTLFEIHKMVQMT